MAARADGLDAWRAPGLLDGSAAEPGGRGSPAAVPRARGAGGTIKSLGVELPGPPQHDQAAANTTVLLRRRFPAPGPLRRHQGHGRVRLASRSSLRLWPPDSQTFDSLIQTA